MSGGCGKMKETFEILNEDDLKIKYEDIIKDLDENQEKAVTSELKDAICISVAGSGKTRVLTRRVAYLLYKGVKEDEIMLLTFTNKAANVMLQRVKDLLKRSDLKVLGGTFHHVATFFLRRYANEIGFGKNFTILTPNDAKFLLDEIREEFLEEVKLSKAEFPTAKVIYTLHTASVNKGIDIEYLDEEYRFSGRTYTNIKLILQRYAERKKDNNCMDFDDLLIKFNELLNIEKVRNEINNEYKYILVDEYQDINHLQYDIIEKLNKNNTLFVVGDMNQSIYGFRGGRVEYIESFQYSHDCNVFTIDTNYRSDPNILKLAEDSINNNYQEYPVKFKGYKPAICKPVLYEVENEVIQAEFIASSIKNKLKAGVSPNEIAILVRGVFFTTKSLETAFRKYNIPYVMKAGFSYYERKHIKDIVAFLTILNNPAAEESFKRAIKLFEGIGEKSVKKVYEDYVKNGKNIETLYDRINSGKLKLSARIKYGTMKFLNLLMETFKKPTIAEMIRNIIDSFYDEYLMKNDEEYLDRKQELNFFVDIAKGYGNDLKGFLEEISLDFAETEAPDKEGKKKPEECITLATIHRAKGLEWDYVYMPFLNEEIFPSKKVIEAMNEEEMEEERRLMYVGITRAKKELIMSFVNYITIARQHFASSSFVRELNSKLYDKKIIRARY